MRTPQERFEENYMAVDVPANNKRGFRIRYVYYGPWYVWNEPDGVIRREKVVYILACLLEALCFLKAATCECAINYHVLVGAPAMLSMAAFLFKAIGTARFCTAGKRMTHPTYQEISGMMKVAGNLESVLLLATSVASVFVMVNKRLPASVLLVAAGYLAAFVFSVVICVRFNKLKYATEKNEIASRRPRSCS